MSDGPVTYSRFPASVSGPGIETRRAAIIVRDGFANIAYATTPKGRNVEATATFQVDEVVRTPSRAIILRGPEGEWTVTSGDGCGCKSPLKTWYTGQLGTPRRVGT